VWMQQVLPTEQTESANEKRVERHIGPFIECQV
jgi:hypothetical protein